ncbi:unnamed protein product [Periconia digitata]|uniref:Uncharacterized protein n=1 Tax=Periconia digitata TaxID=1303443 RepID=A0A9W4UQH0_9PLEO|nr:unnamed protein product [Periconia digitata]
MTLFFRPNPSFGFVVSSSPVSGFTSGGLMGSGTFCAPFKIASSGFFSTFSATPPGPSVGRIGSGGGVPSGSCAMRASLSRNFWSSSSSMGDAAGSSPGVLTTGAGGGDVRASVGSFVCFDCRRSFFTLKYKRAMVYVSKIHCAGRRKVPVSF